MLIFFRPERPFHSLLSQQHAHRIDRFPTNFSSKAFERRFSTLNLRRLKALFRTTFYACGLRPLILLSRNAAPKGLFTFTHFRSLLFFSNISTGFRALARCIFKKTLKTASFAMEWKILAFEKSLFFLSTLHFLLLSARASLIERKLSHFTRTRAAQ